MLKTFLSRPRSRPRLLSQIKTKTKTETLGFKTKTKTCVFVLEAPRDQDLGLEDYNLFWRLIEPWSSQDTKNTKTGSDTTWWSLAGLRQPHTRAWTSHYILLTPDARPNAGDTRSKNLYRNLCKSSCTCMCVGQSCTSFLHAIEHSSIPGQKLSSTWPEPCNMIGWPVAVEQETVMNFKFFMQVSCTSFWYAFLERVSQKFAV